MQTAIGKLEPGKMYAVILSKNVVKLLGRVKDTQDRVRVLNLFTGGELELPDTYPVDDRPLTSDQAMTVMAQNKMVNYQKLAEEEKKRAQARQQAAKKQLEEATANVVVPGVVKAADVDKIEKAAKAPRQPRAPKGEGKCAFIDGLIAEGKWTLVQIYDKAVEKFVITEASELKSLKNTVGVRPSQMKIRGYKIEKNADGIITATK